MPQGDIFDVVLGCQKILENQALGRPAVAKVILGVAQVRRSSGGRALERLKKHSKCLNTPWADGPANYNSKRPISPSFESSVVSF